MWYSYEVSLLIRKADFTWSNPCWDRILYFYRANILITNILIGRLYCSFSIMISDSLISSIHSVLKFKSVIYFFCFIVFVSASAIPSVSTVTSLAIQLFLTRLAHSSVAAPIATSVYSSIWKLPETLTLVRGWMPSDLFLVGFHTCSYSL
jgi:hypothetical protein